MLDGSGWEYQVTVERLERGHVFGRIRGRKAGGGEPNTRIVLFQAVLKGDRFEQVLQKGTELGVSKFVPVFSARSVPKDGGLQRASTRSRRWRKVILEAAEQSRRARLPDLATPATFANACQDAEGLPMLAWEGEPATGIKALLNQIGPGGPVGGAVSIFTGPEGGFAEDEVEVARGAGVAPVSLGPRILRAETAPLVAVAAVMYRLGELGG